VVADDVLDRHGAGGIMRAANDGVGDSALKRSTRRALNEKIALPYTRS
jgi:hypothetical protein